MSVLPPRPGSLRQFFLTALSKGMGKLSRHDETHKKLMIKSHYERTNARRRFIPEDYNGHSIIDPRDIGNR
ncbi:uncharacterized protein PADG_05270 [Paracoccidioides brasiliensis Pb18]|uniref:Uncharacterized protein n=1 Tax=Paracoccidioides brasiliensis (strain Pb18) TaxID=502780 RepID=C1GDD4_PARBD|nr:uncharacterized protein PADG_05270 [Paracoccidioides brasiliensis Pb18]EEH49191.2 hypothetical protein PADG_05270 [Paracoccidioides brasiliensis Pb18]